MFFEKDEKKIEERKARLKDKASKGLVSESKRQNTAPSKEAPSKGMPSKGEAPSKSKLSFGEYGEAPGGGTPVSGGGRGAMNKNFVVAESPDDPIAKQAKNNGQAVRYNQPRDEDGKFTYNSVNGKELSTEQSRGTTPVPFLDGVDLTFFEEGAIIKMPDGRTIICESMTKEQVMEACKKFSKTEGGFVALIGAGITKKGRQSNKEKATPEGFVETRPLEGFGEKTQQRMQEAKSKRPSLPRVSEERILATMGL